MSFLMRKFPISNGRSLVRILALGSVGTWLFYSNYATDYRTSVSVSIPAALQDSLSLPWRTLLEQTPNPALVSSNNNFRHRNLPIFLSLSSTGSSSDVKNEASWDVPRHSCNCLGRDTIANAAARVAPAVVNISAPRGTGSGTIIDADGTILTCAHGLVDSLPNGKVHVSLQDGRVYKGTVVNADVQLDIAIVKITSKTPLPVANLGSSSKLRPGDWVVALGCPHSLQNSITAGIISCVDRKSSDLGLGGIRREYLQTDCAINEGNSGGPLVNIDGELIGINIMKLKKAHGLGFAVPIDTVCSIIEQFKTNRRVVRPWLGLQMIDLNDMIAAELKEQYAAFSNVTKGVLINMVTSGSPADHAGFLRGDIVIEFDGKRIGSLKEIIDIMGDRVGKPLKAVVIRSNDETVILTVIPKEVNPDM